MPFVSSKRFSLIASQRISLYDQVRFPSLRYRPIEVTLTLTHTHNTLTLTLTYVAGNAFRLIKAILVDRITADLAVRPGPVPVLAVPAHRSHTHTHTHTQHSHTHTHIRCR